MDQVKIGKFIAEERNAKGYTQKELAELLGVSDRTISKWETGRGFPEASLVLPICEALDITANELLSGQRLTNEEYILSADKNALEIFRKHQRVKKQTLLLILFTASLLPMLLPQFGIRGVSDITGFDVLFPYILPFVLTYVIGVAVIENERPAFIIGAVGVIGMVAAEIYGFMTWHYMFYTGKISLQASIDFALPEFYIGLGASIMMAFAYFIVQFNMKE